jgi:hypothetical protein
MSGVIDPVRPGATTLEWARKKIGVREATGNNDGPEVEEFLSGDKGLPWCAAFLLWCNKMSLDVRFTRTTQEYYACRNVAHFERVMQERGWWKSLGELLNLPADKKSRGILPGDVIFFAARVGSDVSSGGRHVGIVDEVITGDGNPGGVPVMVLMTIEGNYGNAVSRLRRDLDQDVVRSWVTGFARLGGHGF